MDRSGGLPLCHALLAALAGGPDGGRKGWLRALFRGTCEATGAALVTLTERSGSDWQRIALVDDRLDSQRLPRLAGIGRRFLAGETAALEPVLRRGSPFRSRSDGWPGHRPGGYAAVVLPHEGMPRGWLTALRLPDGPAFDPETLRLLELSARAVSVGLLHEARWKTLEDLAMTDGLTHIPNYRHLRVAIEAEIARSLRNEEFFTLVMVDVDNLKRYNAAHGHLAGSDILRRLAAILRESIRRSDLAGKYGGDEFLLLLPRTRPPGGKVLSERVRRRIGEELKGKSGEMLSCSFGVAGFPEDGSDFESLVQAADRALYRAKEAGRNNVVCLAGFEGRSQEAA